MAARTTTQAGSFTAGATWVGGVAPSSGDTVTINHAVTWTPGAGSFTLGTGTGTAVTIGSSGSLSITPTGSFTLTLAGTWSGTNTTAYELVADSTTATLAIVFDATAATGGFQILTAGAYDVSSVPRGWNLIGNATKRISVSSLPSDGSKNSYFGPTGQNGGGVVRATYVDFLRIGDATNAAFAPNWGSGRTWSVPITNCTFTSCGQYTLSVDSSYTSAYSFTDCVWTSSAVNESTSWVTRISSQTSTGSITFTRCVFDKMVKHSYMALVSYSGCYFNNGWAGSHVATQWTGMDNCFIRQTSNSLILCGSLTNSFIMYDAPAYSNPEFMTNSSALTGSFTLNWTGNAFYFNGSDYTGGLLFAAAASATGVVNIKNNLALANAAGYNSGNLITSNGTVTPGFGIYVEHNTVFISRQNGAEIGHLYGGSVENPPRYKSYKSNLFIGGVDNSFKMSNVDSNSLTDIINPTDADYNGSYGITPTYAALAATYTNQGRGYAAKWSATPGAHDVDGQNPNFVNGSATLTTWGVTQGGTTEADALTIIKAAPATKVAALLAYLASAFAPTNSAFKGTAHDGGDIGAFSVVSGTVPYGNTSAMTGGFSALGF